jgi:hypothetical protein
VAGIGQAVAGRPEPLKLEPVRQRQRHADEIGERRVIGPLALLTPGDEPGEADQMARESTQRGVRTSIVLALVDPSILAYARYQRALAIKWETRGAPTRSTPPPKSAALS